MYYIDYKIFNNFIVFYLKRCCFFHLFLYYICSVNFKHNMKTIEEDLLSLPLSEIIEKKKARIMDKKAMLKIDYENQIAELDHELVELEHYHHGAFAMEEPGKEEGKRRRKVTAPIIKYMKSKPNTNLTTKEITKVIFPNMLMLREEEQQELNNAVSYALSALVKKGKHNIDVDTGTGFKGNYWIYKPQNDMI
jgi:hypothetical protein